MFRSEFWCVCVYKLTSILKIKKYKRKYNFFLYKVIDTHPLKSRRIYYLRCRLFAIYVCLMYVWIHLFQSYDKPKQRLNLGMKACSDLLKDIFSKRHSVRMCLFDLYITRIEAIVCIYVSEFGSGIIKSSSDSINVNKNKSLITICFENIEF